MRFLILLSLLILGSCAHNRNGCINPHIAAGYTMEQAEINCGVKRAPRWENDWRYMR